MKSNTYEKTASENLDRDHATCKQCNVKATQDKLRSTLNDMTHRLTYYRS